jgi:hypothetical protein
MLERYPERPCNPARVSRLYPNSERVRNGRETDGRTELEPVPNERNSLASLRFDRRDRVAGLRPARFDPSGGQLPPPREGDLPGELRGGGEGATVRLVVGRCELRPVEGVRLSASCNPPLWKVEQAGFCPL